MAETILAARPGPAERLRRYLRLTKPRVNTLIVFCAVIGMFLAAPGMVPLQALFAGTLGIALVAGAAAAMNCLIEQEIDALMARTQGRPLPRGEVNSLETLMLSGLTGGIGLSLLNVFVNPFTMWLTLATNGGPVMEYLSVLASDERNALVFVGYQAEGTMGRRIQKGWREIPIGRRGTIAINLEIVTIEGFSGHSDRRQLINYIGHVQPKPEKIFTIHGDENNTIDLASSL